MAITTTLGADVLLLNSFVLREGFNQPYEITAQLCSEDGAIDFDSVVGKAAGIRLEMANGTRYFHGFVRSLRQMDQRDGFARYEAVILPWFWFLNQTRDCRIFQRQSVVDIAEEVFKAQGFGSDLLELRLSSGYPKRRYCVQYRETDFNFINRLLESEGIYYWFEHQEDNHVLVLADNLEANKLCSGYETIPFRVGEEPGHRTEAVTSWVARIQVEPVTAHLRDFDFKNPGDALEGSHQVTRKHGMAEFAVYDYPGEYYEPSDADHYAKLRLEALQTPQQVLQGVTNVRGLAVGQVFELTDHPRQNHNQKYLLTRVTLAADAGEFRSAAAIKFEPKCEFDAIPASTPYRPPRITKKPLIQGPQTAVVVGTSGEEIDTDEFGRVKVQFHWDRYGKSDESSSCWVRVSQPWAGKQWGAITIPRIGQEVIIEFLEGDPDRPIITGRVYNADQTPPYELPANKTQSGIKSRSSKDGTGEDFNEIRFEDKKGSEELYIHAEKNKKVVVENDRTEEVGRDESISIGNNRTKIVEKSESVSIGESRTTDIGKSEDVTVGEKQAVSVGKDQTIEVSENRSLTVGKDERIAVSGNRKEDVTKDAATKIGKKFLLEAGDEIMIRTGSVSVNMKKDGTIVIKGKNISLEGSGKIQIKAASDLILKGSKITEN